MNTHSNAGIFSFGTNFTRACKIKLDALSASSERTLCRRAAVLSLDFSHSLESRDVYSP